MLATFLGTVTVGLITWHKQRSVKMEKEIIGTDIGPEVEVQLKMKDGYVVVAVEHKGADGYVSLAGGIAPGKFLDQLAAMIPGKPDDMAIEALKGALDVK